LVIYVLLGTMPSDWPETRVLGHPREHWALGYSIKY